MKRFQNYGLLVAVASLIGMVLQDAGVIITPEKFQSYVDGVLVVLVLAGIVNNPTEGKGFKDK